MKWFSVFSIIALAFLANACEKHPASDAPEEGVTAFGKHSEAAEEKAETRPSDQPRTEAPASPETKPGEAPKFFPEKK
jgi:hypothetical protein